tara:strand:- start:584 stop:775 length:192 start_codon:yes stop_codon:yes gene_type:complete
MVHALHPLAVEQRSHRSFWAAQKATQGVLIATRDGNGATVASLSQASEGHAYDWRLGAAFSDG